VIRSPAPSHNDIGKLTVEALKSLVWRCFMRYWNRRRICPANGGLPPLLKRQRYDAALHSAA